MNKMMRIPEESLRLIVSDRETDQLASEGIENGSYAGAEKSAGFVNLLNSMNVSSAPNEMSLSDVLSEIEQEVAYLDLEIQEATKIYEQGLEEGRVLKSQIENQNYAKQIVEFQKREGIWQERHEKSKQRLNDLQRRFKQAKRDRQRLSNISRDLASGPEPTAEQVEIFVQKHYSTALKLLA